MTRIDAIQPLRGLVCLSIIVLHFSTWEQGPLLISHRWFQYRPGVESFMVLSGFFIAHSLRPASSLSVARYLQTRFARLVVPYWVVLTIITILSYVRMLRSGRSHRVATHVLAEYAFVNDIFGIPPPAAPLWTLTTLIQLYILTVAAFWVVRRFYLNTTPDYHRRTLEVLKVAAATILIGTAAGHIYGNLSLALITHWKLPHWIPFAAAGFLAYERSTKATIVAAAVLAYTGWLTASTDRPDRWVWGAVTTVAINLLATYNPKIPPTPLNFVGRISFSVYLVHGTIGAYAYLCYGYSYLGDFPKIVYVSAAFVLSLAAGYAFYELVERPTAKYARTIAYRE